jgi:hypothetical protein
MSAFLSGLLKRTTTRFDFQKPGRLPVATEGNALQEKTYLVALVPA